MTRYTVEIRRYCDRGGPPDHEPRTVENVTIEAGDMDALKVRSRTAAGRCRCGQPLRVAFMRRAET